MRRSLVAVATVIALSVGGLLAVVFTGTTPELGLDLQGGLSVVLAPTEGQDDVGEKLDTALDIVRSRVDALGVAEPEISRQGDTIVVDLPGVTDQERARELIGTTAELQFRPVLGSAPLGEEGTPAQPPQPPVVPDGGTGATVPSEAPGDTGDTGETGETPPGDATEPTPTEGDAQGTGGGGGPTVLGQADEPPDSTTTTAGETTTTVAPDDVEEVGPGQEFPADQPIVARDADGAIAYQLGPAEVTGEAVDTAQARFEGAQWVVNVEFTGEGARQWDEMAARYVGQQIAIVLDGVVQSAPVLQTAAFGGEAQITGDFSEGGAKDLALVLRFGALPVELEEISVQEVSATFGRDQLEAGLVAGAIGLALVLAYVLFYYRILGVVIWLALGVTGAAVYALVAWLGQAISLTLTLAGVVGLIVSIGVAVDSNIVYFERVKEEMRGGRTLRSAADRGFRSAFRTIVAADIVTILAAALLWILAIGSVRGFAFYLGLATALDLLVAYFFMHPLVVLIGRRRWLVESKWLGAGHLAGTEPEVARP